METAVPPADPGLRVLVHRCSWCFCRSETFLADHIKLESFMRPLESGQAVALSYGIADFEREKHVFGHVSGLESQSVRLEFGGEWEVSGLMNALVALSEKHGAIWLDQLSMPQDPVSLAIHLQNMPQVYHTLEVVVLLPNSPCPCLRDTLESWATEGSLALEDGDLNLIAVASTCLNAFPVSSYHFRLRTKVEFGYAGTISIHYGGALSGQCSRRIHDWLFRSTRIPKKSEGYLSRWASWKYASCEQISHNEGEYVEEMAWSMLRDTLLTGRDHILDAMLLFSQKKDMDRFFEMLP